MAGKPRMASVFKRSGATTWTVKWTDATGRERQRRTRFRTAKAEAYRLAQGLERKVERQVLGLEPVPVDCPRAPFGEFMDW